MKAKALVVLVLLVACGTKMSRVSSDSAGAGSYMLTNAAKDVSERVAMAPAAFGGRAPAPSKSREETSLPFTRSMIIRNGSVSVEVDSLEIAIDRVRLLAQSLGGYLGNVSMQTGTHQVRSATMELRIPATHFDSAMIGMPTLGKVEQSTLTAEDVGEEWVDVGARVANSRRLESRLVALLAARTGKLQDVIAVERELARVREEIERYEGRMRYLGARVATSTIVANVHEKAPIIAAAPGTNVFVTAFVNMGRNFVGFLAAGIEMLGVLLPAAAIVWLVWFGWRKLRPTVSSRRPQLPTPASS